MPNKPFANLSGKRFSRLLVLNEPPVRDRKKTYWRCRCDCGMEKLVGASNLNSGHVRSCGCLRKEMGSPNRTHGRTGTAEYMIWQAMKRRCENPNTTDYIGYMKRGITICKRWKKFENFLADMGPRPSKDHSIERLDNNGSYTPKNCVWATDHKQTRNKRNNRWFTFEGETLCLSDWARKLGIKRSTLERRIRTYGWPLEKALGVHL
jgi:AraC-like DNA-binding protein